MRFFAPLLVHFRSPPAFEIRAEYHRPHPHTVMNPVLPWTVVVQVSIHVLYATIAIRNLLESCFHLHICLHEVCGKQAVLRLWLLSGHLHLIEQT